MTNKEKRKLAVIAIKKGFHLESRESGWCWDTWVRYNEEDKTLTALGYGDDCWNFSVEYIDPDDLAASGEIDGDSFDTLDEMLDALGWPNPSEEDMNRVGSVSEDVDVCLFFMGGCHERVVCGRLDPEEGIQQVRAWAENARKKLKKIAPRRFAEDREILAARIDEAEDRLCGYIENR